MPVRFQILPDASDHRVLVVAERLDAVVIGDQGDFWRAALPDPYERRPRYDVLCCCKRPPAGMNCLLDRISERIRPSALDGFEVEVPGGDDALLRRHVVRQPAGRAPVVIS